MPERSSATTPALFRRRSHGMDEATRAGIGATLCSVVVHCLAVDAHAAGQHPTCSSIFWTFSVAALIAQSRASKR